MDISDISDVQVGDAVTVMRYGRMTRDINFVERLTATQIILRGGRRYKRRDGQEIGGHGYGRRHIEPTTEAHRLAVRVHDAKQALEKVVVTSANIEHVEAFLRKM